MKKDWKPGTMLYPLPAVLVSCGSVPEEYNLLTIAWTGTICTNPPMCYISVRPERYSYDIIRRNGCFVINLTTMQMAKATDFCGVRSGRDCNKFELTGLTPGKASIVNAPTVQESPVSLECRVTEIKHLGSHDMFMAEIVNVQVDERYLLEDGTLDMASMNLMAYAHGRYFEVAHPKGFFGWSVRRKKNTRRNLDSRS